MKNIFYIFCFHISLAVVGFSQTIPQGMNYQAVALNAEGKIIPNQKISLKLYLFSIEHNHRLDHYLEIHEATTNAQGLFNLVIGEGVKENGEFNKIPWNVENIWMEVAIKEKSQGTFATVSHSKLLAVPYAIHANTASKLVNTTSPTNNLAPPEPGVISNTWSVFGNAYTDSSGNLYHTNSLGTTDKVDLFLITDNVERFRVLNGGNIVTKLNFDVAQNLTVGNDLIGTLSATIGDSLIAKKDVAFNTVSGSTLVYGPFSVLNGNATLLSGKLNVDLASTFKGRLNVDGPTDFNDSLFVNNKSATKLTGTLQVDSTTTFKDSLFVTNISPTILTGTLLVDSCATFNHQIKITSNYLADTSGLTPSGSLQVGGGLYIKKNLFVGGVVKFNGPAAFNGPVAIQDGTQSTSPTTGALRVTGGVGIGLNLNVGGGSMIGGITTVSDLTESIDINTGALKVWGGVGIKKRLNVRGDTYLGNFLTVSGATTLNNTLTVNSGDPFVANFINNTNQHGIKIMVNNAAPGWANNLIEFKRNDGGVVGRIEGENGTQFTQNSEYKREVEKLNDIIIAASVNTTVASISTIIAGAGLVAAISSATTCVSLGFLGCVPVYSLIVKGGLDVTAAAIAVGVAAAGLDFALERKKDYQNYKMARIGVTYESGAGDYAEWLPKADPSESFLPGYIVGLINGRISKNLTQASKYMVISTQPIILGNMQDKSQELAYEKVAFLGQVPVHVLGKVKVGDYILPSGNNDGLGRAVSPDQMTTMDYTKIVGVAWSSSTNDTYDLINVAIGLHGTDMHKVILDQNKRIQHLSERIDKRNTLLAKIVPGYKEAAGIKDLQETNYLKATTSATPGSSFKDLISNDGNGVSFNISIDMISDMLNQAEQAIQAKGGNLNGIPMWDKIKSDPLFKQQILTEVQSHLKSNLPQEIERIKQRYNVK